MNLHVYMFAFYLLIGFSRTENNPQKWEWGRGYHTPVFSCFTGFRAMMDFQGADNACVFKMTG